MSRIGADHLARDAVVYVRQSTPGQLRHNHESRRRQYGLAERARSLGWREPAVIDEDLGRSGGGTSRPGFERLLAAICEGRVGMVLSLEASRLARNGRDWHTLLEFCALVGCLLGDEDGIYDPRQPNDRLLLGMKGTLSEMELSTLRQRSEAALRLKASRGELFLGVAVGYVRERRDRIAKDPDRRVREAVELVFGKFAQLRSVRQVHLWLRQEDLRLPASVHDGGEWRTEWRPAVYGAVHRMLTNPVYAGAYAYGRTGSRVTVENGRKRVRRGVRRERADWDVLIRDHHEGYVSWDEFERNQRLIADNANCQGAAARGAVRRGEALLGGLLRCAHCGRRLRVHYGGGAGRFRYRCLGGDARHGAGPCIGFGGARVDAAVGAEVVRLLSPLGVEAALAAIGMREGEHAATRRQSELALAEARYEADLARRPVRRRGSRQPVGGGGAGAPLERPPGRGAPAGTTRRGAGCRWFAGPLGRREGTPDGARRRCRDGVGASGRDGGDPQGHRARAARTGRGRAGRRPHRVAAALVRRGPHASARAARAHRGASLADGCAGGGSRPRAGEAAAGQGHRRGPEPPGQEDGARQHLDAGEGVQPPQRPRRGRPPPRGDGGTRRADAQGRRGAARHEQDDRVAADRRRDDRRRARVQGRAVGDPEGTNRRAPRHGLPPRGSSNARSETERARFFSNIARWCIVCLDSRDLIVRGSSPWTKRG